MTAKYVELNSLLQKAKSLQNKLFAVPLILDAIEYAPTVDVVEVVRCKDCEFYETLYCVMDEIYSLSDNDFCSYGKRKEGVN